MYQYLFLNYDKCTIFCYMLLAGETEWGVCGNSLYQLLNFSVSQKLLLKIEVYWKAIKTFILFIGKMKVVLSLIFIFQVFLKISSINLSWWFVRKYLNNNKLTTFLYPIISTSGSYLLTIQNSLFFTLTQTENKRWKPLLLYISPHQHISLLQLTDMSRF